jgi:uncharacterized protein (TIGR01777 family)
MRVLISGGTGFLGRPLARALSAEGHSIRILSRTAAPGVVQWDPTHPEGAWTSAIEDTDVVVNLAGESIGTGRWTVARKQAIRDSRVLTTRAIATAIRNARSRPVTLISASGIGYYGPRGDEVVTEDTPAGDDFIARVCRDWEAEAVKAEEAGTRVVLLRSGVVLDRGGGALEPMVLPYKMFVGGPVGSGRQYLAWIHREDWIRLVVYLMLATDADGAFNATSPAPVTNAEMSAAIARVLHRPALVHTPAFALRLILGEMADALLLTGQRAVPNRALQMGFTFKYPTVAEALEAILR